MEMKKSKNTGFHSQRAQAAVTDALYFLLIVTFLSIFLFGFANTYGNSIKQQVNDEFDTAFATNSLKAILYSSTPRDPKMSFKDKDAEIDSLLAILKEDYADDSKIGENERIVLGKTISAVLAPVQDTKDYIFVISVPNQTEKSAEFIFLFFHTTNFRKEPATDASGNPLPGKVYIYSSDLAKPHIDYFCAINRAEYEKLNAKITHLLTNVGPVSQSSAIIRMLEYKPEPSTFNAQADLFLWDAMWLGTTKESDNALFYSENPAVPDTEWGCIEANLT